MSSAGVTRPDRPGIDLSKQPPAVRLNKELGFVLTFKLKVIFYACILFMHHAVRIKYLLERKRNQLLNAYHYDTKHCVCEHGIGFKTRKFLLLNCRNA